MRNLSGTTVAYIGFVFGVVGFMALGIFIAGLAAGSWLAAVPAGIAAGAFAAAALEIRIAGRREGGLWGKPVDVDLYEATYRPRQPSQWMRSRYSAIRRAVPSRPQRI